ncbi:SOS response-associated peptidase [Loktanella sp. F6476L]|uniref:SOS response-associated peptidase n=1 Tax=Loktanella sp. F6476L TaxID=2926405 RepID=UPI001FF36975|nr:SOS response-associated peptidase [Loktanella sp. F6476L]MCK0121676.1 SOS response-associated peptidase [Loktanella sp. F6476L]
MCGRMAITLPHEAVVEMFGAVPANDLPDTPNYNVCPTVNVPVVTSDDGVRRLRPMRWGFIPHWYKKPNGGPLLINARAETIAEKPAFRAACRERRCLLPVTGFYEWYRDGDAKPLPWFIQRQDGEPLVMAGIWQDWEQDGAVISTCAIVTTGANEAMARIHHRIPVILTAEDWPLWLGEAGKGASKIMKSAPEDALLFHRVGTEVNSNRAAGATLLDPIA